MADRFRNRSPMNRNASMTCPRAYHELGSYDLPEGTKKSSCSCEHAQKTQRNGCSSGCKETLRRLQTIDFSMADVILYLDAYPHSAEAKAYYGKLLSQRQALVQTLSEDCHMPITPLDEPGSGAWHWIDGPWPWSIEAN